jgi:MFS family permease
MKPRFNNVSRIYLFNFFHLFLVIIPVLIPYFMSLGLSMHDIFFAQAAFGLSVALFEIPSGYLADVWGRKRILVVGSLIYGLGFTFFYFARNFWHVMAFELFIGIGSSFISGADLSLLYDSRHETKHGSGSRVIANYWLFSSIGESVAALIGGVIASISLSTVALAQMAAGWMPFLTSLFLRESQHRKMATASGLRSHWKNLKRVFATIFEDAGTRRVFFSFTAYGLTSFIAVWIFQKHWHDSAVPLAVFGVLWAAYNLAAGMTSRMVPGLELRFGARRLLVVMALLPVFGYFGMAAFVGWTGVLIGICFQIQRGINQVILKAEFNARMPSEMRATANSITSMAFRGGFFILGPLVGYGIDTIGLQAVLNLLGAACALLLITPIGGTRGDLLSRQ